MKPKSLPSKYAWLPTVAELPNTIKEALKEFGQMETPGTGNNPEIIAWAKEVSQPLANVYKADSIPWCGLFMAVVAKRAGKNVVKDPLWALNWGTFGVYTKTPGLGDVLVFTRKTATGATAGHVGLYVGEDATHYHVLGGNQADQVCFSRIAKNRLYTARRPNYTKAPASAKPIQLSSTGTPSTNED